MDFNSILVVTLGALLALALLVVAGVTLQARSYTQLLELLHYIGSRVEANKQELRQVRTFLSNGTEKGSTSAPKDAIPTTPEDPQP